VDASNTRLRLRRLSNWGGVQAKRWAGVPFEAVRLPALRHLNLYQSSSTWRQYGAAHVRGAARLVAEHATSLRTLPLSFWIKPHQESRCELGSSEGDFLESVLLAAPLPALQRLDLYMEEFAATDEARSLEALRLLARLSLPRLTHLSLDAYSVTGRGMRWLEGAHLPGVRRLRVIDYSEFTPDHTIAALSAPRWSALETLELVVYDDSGGLAALSAALAPTLRRLVVCAEEWPQLRILEVVDWGALALDLGPVRLERLVVDEDESAPAFLEGFAALLAELRAAWPALEVRLWQDDDWTQA
jgi:hypothetical protein